MLRICRPGRSRKNMRRCGQNQEENGDSVRPRKIIEIPVIVSPQQTGIRACRMGIKLVDLEQVQRVTNVARKGVVVTQNIAVQISLCAVILIVVLSARKVRSNVGQLVAVERSYRLVAPGLPSGPEC